MCRRRGLKVNAGKSKMMVLGGEEGFVRSCGWDVISACVRVEILVLCFGWIWYRWCEYHRKVASGGKISSAAGGFSGACSFIIVWQQENNMEGEGEV